LIVVAGEALIDLIVSPDGRVTPAPGGGPYNAARTIGRLGGDVSFLGCLSDDRFGRLLRERLEADGVDTRLVVETSRPTTLVLAEIDDRGAAHYGWYIADTSAPGLHLEAARRGLHPPPDALHVGTLGLTLEPIADSLAAMVAESPAGTLVMVDPNCRPRAVPDPDRYRARLLAVLRRADIVKASAEDLDYLSLASSHAEAARRLLGAGARAVLVTHGGEAVDVHWAGGSLRVGVPRVAVVDSVGAGDAFGGAFLARWLEHGLGRHDLDDGPRLAEAAGFAARVASMTCQRAGAEPPTRAELG
jgi:fructokinase